MPKLMECVPNFSLGQDKEKLEQILNQIRSVPGVRLLDYSMDASQNRSVTTFVGEPEAVSEAAFLAIQEAAKLIDMTVHKGEHPRMGATDVCPFVPISDMTMDECAEYAKSLGKRVGEELNIPVYLYEAAADAPYRKNLADIRRGEYEGMAEKMKRPEWKPNFGPTELGTAGVTAIGARPFLIAYNIYLNTTNISVAKKIASRVRAKNGGFSSIKALGFMSRERACVEVSMNMVDFKKSSLYHAFEFIKREAENYGVTVSESEIVGLVPQEALLDAAKWYLRLHSFDNAQIFENNL